MINVGVIISTEGCSVPWGVILNTMGDILSTVGDVQYRGRYHDACGVYLEYRGGVSTVG